jgi:hypothetical protein
MYVFVLQCLHRPTVAALFTVTFLFFPACSISRIAMTIDAPFACCWGWALVAAHRAVWDRSQWAWAALGACIAIGILAKYTMILFPMSLAMFCLATRDYRKLLVQRGFWLCLLIGAIGGMPIVLWNATNDWVSLRHVGGQAGVTRSGINWLGPISYLTGQFAIMLGGCFVVWARAIVALNPMRTTDATLGFLWWLSVPTFIFFGLFSFRTSVNVNWPVTAYLAGMVLGTAWLLARSSSRSHRWTIVMGIVAILSLGLTVLARNTRPAAPLFDRAGEVLRPNAEIPLRHVDPTIRMRGWRALACEVDRIRHEIRKSGSEPVVAAMRWTMASELAFYCVDRPPTHAIGSAFWDRHSQYDHWRPNPLADAQQFLGRDFVFVDNGPLPKELVAAFDEVHPTIHWICREDGRRIASFDITVCRRFRGISASPGSKSY